MTNTGVRLHVGHQHSRFLSFLTRLMDYCSTFCGPKRFPWLSNHKMCLHDGRQDSQFGPILARFLDYYSMFRGPRVISMINETRVVFTCRSSTLIVLADSGPFHGLLLTVLGPKAISMVLEPKVRLRVGHQHSQFRPILARFLDYYSLFWVPKAISIVVEPQGAFTCRLSTLTVLADSGPYRGLLLIVLGSQIDFVGCQSARCDYVSVINNRSFGRFWPVS